MAVYKINESRRRKLKESIPRGAIYGNYYTTIKYKLWIPDSEISESLRGFKDFNNSDQYELLKFGDFALMYVLVTLDGYVKTHAGMSVSEKYANYLTGELSGTCSVLSDGSIDFYDVNHIKASRRNEYKSFDTSVFSQAVKDFYCQNSLGLKVSTPSAALSANYLYWMGIRLTSDLITDVHEYQQAVAGYIVGEGSSEYYQLLQDHASREASSEDLHSHGFEYKLDLPGGGYLKFISFETEEPGKYYFYMG